MIINCQSCDALAEADIRDDQLCTLCVEDHLDYIRPDITKWMMGLTPIEKSNLIREVMSAYRDNKTKAAR